MFDLCEALGEAINQTWVAGIQKERKMFDINAKVDEWKKKALAGTLTRDEMKEAIILLRGSRKMSVEVQTTKKEAAKKPDVKSLLDDFASQMSSPAGKL